LPARSRLGAALAALTVLTAPTAVAGRADAEPADPAASPAEVKLRLVPVARAFDPTHVTQPPGDDGLLFITTRDGLVIVVKNGIRAKRPFLDLRGQVDRGATEQGLLSIAFPPDYRRSGLFYVAYTARDRSLVLSEFRRSRRSRLRAAFASERVVLRIEHRKPKHYGGLALFEPGSHRLYLSSGDGGPLLKPRKRSQSRRSLLGKILRIDPRRRGKRPYTIPPDNPFARKPGADEIFALGLRNPWRFDIDPETKAMAIGDVGRFDSEEVNLVTAGEAPGANYGWPAFEGMRKRRKAVKAPGALFPDISYGHGPGCAVIGGVFVHDRSLPELEGRFLYADACSGEIRSFEANAAGNARDDRPLGAGLPPNDLFGIVSFGQDSRGRVYAASFAGTVFRLERAGG
jgi:glucose/arabinose dehydrogenase